MPNGLEDTRPPLAIIASSLTAAAVWLERIESRCADIAGRLERLESRLDAREANGNGEQGKSRGREIETRLDP